jgi:hypothetical protein
VKHVLVASPPTVGIASCSPRRCGAYRRDAQLTRICGERALIFRPTVPRFPDPYCRASVWGFANEPSTRRRCPGISLGSAQLLLFLISPHRWCIVAKFRRLPDLGRRRGREVIARPPDRGRNLGIALIARSRLGGWPMSSPIRLRDSSLHSSLRRTRRWIVGLLGVLSLLTLTASPGALLAAAAGSTTRASFCSRLRHGIQASSGAEMFCRGQQPSGPATRQQRASPAGGSPINVDAATPSEDQNPAGVQAYGRSRSRGPVRTWSRPGTTRPGSSRPVTLPGRCTRRS